MTVSIELKHISKRFGNFYANQDISLTVEKGTIHAIVGENGAGKSTLMKILYGLYEPTSGEIYIKGKRAHLTSPTDAIRLGIGMVHQHFMLVPTLTVAENIILGEEPTNHGIIDFDKVHNELKALSEKFGLAISPDALVSTLSVGEEQRVEILKVLYRKADILILDEPTAVLTPIETEQLFQTLRSLAQSGKTILIITHKLDEVLAISNRVSVMRQGKLVATMQTKETTKEALARAMVGREVLLSVPKTPCHEKDVVLSVRNLCYTNSRGVKVLNNLSFEIKAGEIYGIAGVEGNGQSELLKALWGMQDEGDMLTGEIKFGNINLLGKSPREIASLGISHIPEDRLRYGVIKDYSISNNLIFGRHREPTFAARIGFKWNELARYALDMATLFDVRSAWQNGERSKLTDAKIGSLSGGNQQKLVSARELGRPQLRLLILAQPTRGVDIGAIEFIHRKIIETRDKGIAILLISAELDEVLSLSDRIGCLYKGTIRKEFSKQEVLQGKEQPKEFEKEIGVFIT
ncbi:MAG: ABC transporter ATP-binding protein [Chloroherpetonaceae bacterium]